MKIGIVCYPTFGGSGVLATELGKALAKQGNEVHFITYAQPVRLGSISKNLFYHEVRVSDYPLFHYQPYELVLSSKLVDVAIHEKLDLLHVHYAIPHASAAIMAQDILRTKGINIPVVTTLHGTDITLVGKDASFEPVITYAINRSNGVTAVSESLKADTYKHFAIEKDIIVIPNFVCQKNLQSKKEALEDMRLDYAPNGEKMLVHISNFRPVKRVEDVVKIFKLVHDKMPCKLLLVGDGPERANVEKMCRDLKICNDVEILGKLKNPTEALYISDLFLLPSETESFGLVALEAMALGVPVIASNTGGIPEVVEQGVSGYLSNVGDVNEMATNAIFLLENHEVHLKFKDAAKKQALQFDIDKILPKYMAVYQKVITAAKQEG
jgi:N-acetyl-alpha-D-glucosaminyl L-malate synthase BshA